LTTALTHTRRIQAREEVIHALAVDRRTTAHTVARVHRTTFVRATVRVAAAVSAAFAHAALSVIAQTTARIRLSITRLVDAALSGSVTRGQLCRVASGGSDTCGFLVFAVLNLVRKRQIRRCGIRNGRRFRRRTVRGGLPTCSQSQRDHCTAGCKARVFPDRSQRSVHTYLPCASHPAATRLRSPEPVPTGAQTGSHIDTKIDKCSKKVADGGHAVAACPKRES
jgi:hypothetical protein